MTITVDPRGALSRDQLVHCGNPMHPDMFKTLTLLTLAWHGFEWEEGGSQDKLLKAVPPLYFVTASLSFYGRTPAENREHARYFYEEHTCPTNVIGRDDGCLLVAHRGDPDPHGIFKHVDTVWWTKEFDEVYLGNDPQVDAVSYLCEVFPQLRGGDAAPPPPTDNSWAQHL